MGKTIYDIAKELNVAPSTVSKALNGKSGISDKTREKILKYAEEVRYYANYNASKLKMKKSFSIGVVYSEDLDIGLEHFFFSSILQNFKTYVECEGYEITFVITNLGNRKMTYLDFCRQKNVEGVLILTSYENDPYLEELVESDIYCVTTDLYHENLYTVISDNIKGSHLAVEHLYQNGHRKIGHVSEQTLSLAASERMTGFKDSMQKFGLNINEDYIFHTKAYAFEDGYEVGKAFLALKEYPTAMFVVADIVALGFIRALKDGGLKVPEDVSVIGFDDIPFASHFDPPLTTISQDAKTIGQTAGKVLLKQIQNKAENWSGIYKVPVTLKERNSVKTLKQ